MFHYIESPRSMRRHLVLTTDDNMDEYFVISENFVLYEKRTLYVMYSVLSNFCFYSWIHLPILICSDWNPASERIIGPYPYFSWLKVGKYNDISISTRLVSGEEWGLRRGGEGRGGKGGKGGGNFLFVNKLLAGAGCVVGLGGHQNKINVWAAR